MIYVFGEYTLNTKTRELQRAGEPIRLQPKVFQVLVYLVEHRDRLVSKEELLDTLWPNEYVDDSALARCVMALRRVFGDHSDAPQYIKTLRRQGYRFIASVKEEGEFAPSHPASASEISSSHYDPTGASSVPSTSGSPPPLAGEERKQVTVLSCTIANISVLAEQMGIEGLLQFRDSLYTLAQAEAQRYGGMIQPGAGHDFLLVFGVPISYEDHAQRAILTASRIQQRLQESREERIAPLQVRMGVHTGLAVIGQSNPLSPHSLTVVGEPLDVASRLQHLAEPGTIFMSAATAHLVRHLVRLEEVMGSGHVDEWSTRQPVYRLREVTSRLEHRPRSLSRFIGRESELALLQRRLEYVRNSQGQVVVIRGDPGIGKSRILAEFRQEVKLQEVTYLEGYCQPYGGTIPYWLLCDLLQCTANIADLDPPEVYRDKVHYILQEIQLNPEVWAPYLLLLLGVQEQGEGLQNLSPQTIKRRTFEAFHQLYLHWSSHRPLIIAIEDLHWIDATSEEYLVSLVERIAKAPVLLLLTTRPGYQPSWMGKSYATQITLQPLAYQHSRQLVRSILGQKSLLNPLVQQILTKAEGNPFFLEELARTLMEQGDVDTLSLPVTIQAVLAARMDRLPPNEKRLLQIAAVIGTEVHFSLLQAITALPEETLYQQFTSL